MGAEFLDYRFIVFSTRDGKAIPRSIEDPSERKVLIVLSDESGTVPTEFLPHYYAVFKCYMPSDFPGTNLFPFNLGYVRGVDAPAVRPIDERQVTASFS